MSPLTKSFIYRNLVLIPKGLAQMSKTVLGPFTHSRNFFSAALTALHRGNIFINPMKIIEFAGTSRRTIQPQMMYRITGNPKWRNTKESQALYKFLLDEGVTNQSATYRDVMGIWEDIGKGGNFWSRSFNSLGKQFKGVTRVARDLYVAEDDYFRVFNFLAEGHKLKEAFKAATFNAAKSIKRSKSIGLLDVGYKADILFWEIDSLNEIPYWFNSDRIKYVLKNGKLIFKNNID